MMFFTLTWGQAGSVSLRVLGSLQGHISSVRSLAVVASADQCTLLFSGGGRASMRAWLIETARLRGEDSGKSRLSATIHSTSTSLFISYSSWSIICLTSV